jgi:hypothetical protein
VKTTLLVVTLVLIAGAFYLGFFPRRRLFRRSAKAAALTLPLIALALGYAIWQEAIAVSRLAEHIDPYPGIASTLWVPPIPGTRAQHWIFKTPDGREAVSRFYANEANRRGWRAVEDAAGGYLVLKKGSACLDIFASESMLGTQGRETTIVYTLREECAAAGQPRSSVSLGSA